MKQPNPYEELARTNKAIKLADLLQGYGIAPETAQGFSHAHWTDLARLANCAAPSDATKKLVVDMLRARGQKPDVKP